MEPISAALLMVADICLTLCWKAGKDTFLSIPTFKRNLTVCKPSQRRVQPLVTPHHPRIPCLHFMPTAIIDSTTTTPSASATVSLSSIDDQLPAVPVFILVGPTVPDARRVCTIPTTRSPLSCQQQPSNHYHPLSKYEFQIR